MREACLSYNGVLYDPDPGGPLNKVKASYFRKYPHFKPVCPCCGKALITGSGEAEQDLFYHQKEDVRRCLVATCEKVRAVPLGALDAPDAELRKRLEFLLDANRFDLRQIEPNRAVVAQWRSGRGWSIEKEVKACLRMLKGRESQENEFFSSAQDTIKQILPMFGVAEDPLLIAAFCLGEERRFSKGKQKWVTFLPGGVPAYQKDKYRYRLVNSANELESVWFPRNLYYCFIDPGPVYTPVLSDEGKGPAIILSPLSKQSRNTEYYRQSQLREFART